MIKKYYLFNKMTCFDFGFPLLIFNFFVFLPVLVTYLNPYDSDLSSASIFLTGILVTAFLLFFYLAFNSIVKIPERIKKIFSALAIFIFIKIIFAPTNTGMIDGLKKNATIDVEVFLDLFVFLILVIAILSFMLKKNNIKYIKSMIIAVSIAAFSLVLFSIIFSFNTDDDIKNKFWNNFKDNMMDKGAFEEFGTDKNIIVILWDGMQGTIAEQVFNDAPESFSAYDGFTFYPDAIGVAPLTTRILPILYSGKSQFYYAQSYKVISKTMYEDSFFNDAKNNGYKVACKGLMPNITIGGYDDYEQFDNLKSIKSGSVFRKYSYFLYASQKRITPLLVQRSILPWANSLRKAKVATVDSSASASDDDISTKMLNYFNIDKFSLGEYKSKLIYFHPPMVHEPYCYNNFCDYSNENAKYVFSVALLKTNVVFFQKLKNLGIYDSSLILIISDHGGRVPETSKGLKMDGADFDLSFAGISQYPAGAYNPLIMIKRPYSKGILKISTKPAMLKDVRGLISSSILDKDIEKEPLLNYANILERDITLELTIDPDTGGSLAPHSYINFSGTLKDIPERFQIKHYVKDK